MSYSNDSGSRHQVPETFKLLFPPEVIATRVGELGQDISRWCRCVRDETGKDVVAIPVLRGAIYFFSDLTRAIDTSVEVAPIRAFAYDNAAIGVHNSAVSIVADGVDVRGRVVLIIDDVCDSGRTLEELERAMLERGAREVRSVVFVRRLLSVPSFVPCWVGYEYSGKEWFVGYGLEAQERWRNLPGVYGVKPT